MVDELSKTSTVLGGNNDYVLLANYLKDPRDKNYKPVALGIFDIYIIFINPFIQHKLINVYYVLDMGLDAGTQW
jgi:hypothetical protein